MTFKRVVYASTLAAGVGLAGLFGVGLGTAAANLDKPATRRVRRPVRSIATTVAPATIVAPAPVDWQHRGIDQGRKDHQPFNWNGQQVTPMRAGNGAGWGFWFLDRGFRCKPIASLALRPDRRRRPASSRQQRAARRRRVPRAGPPATPRAAADRAARLPRPRSASGRPPCAPTPGTSTGPASALTSGGDRRASRRRRRRPNPAPATRSWLPRAASTIDCATVRPSVDGALHARALGVRRRGEHEHPAAVRRGEVEQRPQRTEPQVGRRGDGVGGQRRVTRPCRRRRRPSSSRCRRAWRRRAPARPRSRSAAMVSSSTEKPAAP